MITKRECWPVLKQDPKVPLLVGTKGYNETHFRN